MTVADIPQLIERARAHLDVEDFEAARSDYEAVLARDKDMTEALIGQGDSCLGSANMTYQSMPIELRLKPRRQIQMPCLVWRLCCE